MWKKHALIAAGLTAGLAMAWAGASSAAEAPETLAGPQAPAVPDGAAAQPRAEPDEALSAMSGRGEAAGLAVALTDQNLSAVNSGNTISANTVSSGAITLQDSALSAFSGIGNILMNTGHNNNLQSTMSVTIVITP
jgi:hypothetical protein